MMDVNITTLVSKIPDFDEFAKLADEIGILLYEKLRLEKDIKAREATIVREVTTNPQYRLENKVPTMSYIESTYRFSGLDGELLPLRDSLAQVISELERKKITLSVYKDMIEVFRTISANQRTALS